MIVHQEVTTKFSGHETFTLRYGWLTKAVAGVKSDPGIFARDNAMVAFGVGKNMVRSIRHWCMAFGIIEEDPDVPNNRGRFLRTTRLGEFVLADRGIDPYLEDSGTLWLLHFQLASSPVGPTTWYWTFNHCPRTEFTVDQLVADLLRLASDAGDQRSSAGTIRRDVNCFVRTYLAAKRSRSVAIEDTLDCPLVELGLLHEIDDSGSLGFSRGDHPTLPTHVFAFALLTFWRTRAAEASTLSFNDIAYESGSPGRVFKLTESAVSDHLRQLNDVTGGALTFDSTGGLSQVYRHRECDPLEVMHGKRMRRAGR